MGFLLQCFCQEVAGDVGGLLLLVAESVVGVRHEMPLALWVQIVETLTIGVGYYSVGIAMQDALGILYLIEHGHVLELALALAVSVEIEADDGDAFLVEAIRQAVEELAFLVAAKSVAEYEEGSLLASLCLLSTGMGGVVWTVDDYVELAMVALDGGVLGGGCYAEREKGASRKEDGFQILHVVTMFCDFAGKGTQKRAYLQIFLFHLLCRVFQMP